MKKEGLGGILIGLKDLNQRLGRRIGEEKENRKSLEKWLDSLNLERPETAHGWKSIVSLHRMYMNMKAKEEEISIKQSNALDKIDSALDAISQDRKILLRAKELLSDAGDERGLRDLEAKFERLSEGEKKLRSEREGVLAKANEEREKLMETERKVIGEVKKVIAYELTGRFGAISKIEVPESTITLDLESGVNSAIYEVKNIMAGTEIIPGFIVKKVLGVSNAIVYLSLWKEKGMDVALKMPHVSPGETLDSAVLDQFIKEAEIWSKLKHPYIIRLYKFGMRPLPWIAMEYAPRDFSVLMKQDMRTKVQFFIKVLDALAYAHGMKIIHRDIKPQNILIDSKGNPKLTDWGLAKIMRESMTRTGSFRGSIEFAAPEQFIGQYDLRTDIFQIASVMYYTFTGSLAFPGNSEHEMMHRIINENARPMREINPKIPEALDRVVMTGLNKNMNQRWQTAEAFKNALEEVMR